MESKALAIDETTWDIKVKGASTLNKEKEE